MWRGRELGRYIKYIELILHTKSQEAVTVGVPREGTRMTRTRISKLVLKGPNI